MLHTCHTGLPTARTAAARRRPRRTGGCGSARQRRRRLATTCMQPSRCSQKVGGCVILLQISCCAAFYLWCRSPQPAVETCKCPVFFAVNHKVTTSQPPFRWRGHKFRGVCVVCRAADRRPAAAARGAAAAGEYIRATSVEVAVKLVQLQRVSWLALAPCWRACGQLNAGSCMHDCNAQIARICLPESCCWLLVHKPNARTHTHTHEHILRLVNSCAASWRGWRLTMPRSRRRRAPACC